ncbi:MAG: arginine N-succinyltransferase [Candidatus Latescibacterota bacterium]
MEVATVDELQPVRESRIATFDQMVPESLEGPTVLVAGVGEMDQFRAVMATIGMREDGVVLDTATATTLDIRPGESLRWCPLPDRNG